MPDTKESIIEEAKQLALKGEAAKKLVREVDQRIGALSEKLNRLCLIESAGIAHGAILRMPFLRGDSRLQKFDGKPCTVQKVNRVNCSVLFCSMPIRSRGHCPSSG